MICGLPIGRQAPPGTANGIGQQITRPGCAIEQGLKYLGIGGNGRTVRGDVTRAGAALDDVVECTLKGFFEFEGILHQEIRVWHAIIIGIPFKVFIGVGITIGTCIGSAVIVFIDEPTPFCGIPERVLKQCGGRN